jgi:hypothetical protein
MGKGKEFLSGTATPTFLIKEKTNDATEKLFTRPTRHPVEDREQCTLFCSSKTLGFRV